MKVRITLTSKPASRLLDSLGAGQQDLWPIRPFYSARLSRGASSSRSVRAGHRLSPDVLLGPVAVTLLLWFTSPHDISVIQAIAAFVLLQAPWYSYRHWQRSGCPGLPLFSMLVAMYWLFFSVPLFWGDHVMLNLREGRRVISSPVLTETMLLVMLGIGCLWLGMRSGYGRRMAPRSFPEISSKPLTWIYLLGVAAFGSFTFGDAQAGGARQIFLTIQTTTSLAALLILFQRVLDKKAGKLERNLLILLLAIRVVYGVASGWLGAAATLAESCAFMYLHRYRRFPAAILACALPYVVFFQAGKEEFRQNFWYGGREGSTLQKTQFWVDASLRAWQQAFENPSDESVSRILSSELSRTSLLTHAANVLEQTPAIVPYQYGSLYSYLAVALIPRFLWPEKPLMNEANQFYQVAYGITREQDLNIVSIAVGTLAEGYINFSWFGAALVMFLIGVLLDFWNQTFLARGGTVLAAGIGIAMVPQLLSVESQMAQLVSGIVQHVFLMLVVYFPVLRWRSVVLKPVPGRAPGIAGARF